MVFRDFLHTLNHTRVAVVPDPTPHKCIVEHLNWLLNTTRDRLPHLVSYGLPSFEEYLNEANAELHLATDLKHVIERYESRLSDVHVKPEAGKRGQFEGQFHAFFTIVATVVQTSERVTFEETAEVCRDGTVGLHVTQE